MVDLNKLELARVEVVKRQFNNKNQVVEEHVEFWYPPDKKQKKIGFNS